MAAVLDLAAVVVAFPAYMIVHELVHLAAARARGLRAEFRLLSDGLVVSPGVVVKGDAGWVDRLLVLYSPYVVNIALLVLGPLQAKLVGLLTLPNALLEEEGSRRIRLVAALVLLLVEVFLVEKLGPARLGWASPSLRPIA